MRMGEQQRNAQFLQMLDLYNAEKYGLTPLSEAMKERYGATVNPFVSATNYAVAAAEAEKRNRQSSRGRR